MHINHTAAATVTDAWWFIGSSVNGETNFLIE